MDLKRTLAELFAEKAKASLGVFSLKNVLAWFLEVFCHLKVQILRPKERKKETRSRKRQFAKAWAIKAGKLPVAKTTAGLLKGSCFSSKSWDFIRFERFPKSFSQCQKL